MLKLLKILLLSFVLIPLAVFADDNKPDIVSHINNGGTIVIEQPRELDQRMIYNEDTEQDDTPQTTNKRTGSVSAIGYRVEIYADNNARTAKSQASTRRNRVGARLPQYATYMVFEAPYWRVRVGDFHSRQEAESAMAEIKRVFPAYTSDLRIVRSRVK